MSSSSLTLYATRADFGLPDTSSFVIKTEVQLKMAGVTYDRASAIPPQAPNGKLPFINYHDELVSDSTFIRAHIERKYGADLDAGLDVRQRAESWAIERLLEDHLYFATVLFRWIDPENFAKGPAHFADGAPEADRRAGRALDRLPRTCVEFFGIGAVVLPALFAWAEKKSREMHGFSSCHDEQAQLSSSPSSASTFLTPASADMRSENLDRLS